MHTYHVDVNDVNFILSVECDEGSSQAVASLAGLMPCPCIHQELVPASTKRDETKILWKQ